jgi:Mce-associated membrane protein
MTTNGLKTSVPADDIASSEQSDSDDVDPTHLAEGADRRVGHTATDDVVNAKPRSSQRFRLKRALVLGTFPTLALILAAGSGYLKWDVDSAREAQTARVQSVQAATESTVAILSYQPDSAEKDLTAARDRLGEPFKEQYTKLITDVVIPGAKQKKISAVANVPEAASISATANHAEVLVFIDQSIVIGTDAPTTTSSAVRVNLDKEGNRWLVTKFDPV